MISIKASTRFRIAVARSNFSRVGFLRLLFFFPLIAVHILSSWDVYIIYFKVYKVKSIFKFIFYSLNFMLLFIS